MKTIRIEVADEDYGKVYELILNITYRHKIMKIETLNDPIEIGFPYPFPIGEYDEES